jgi:hypothetical protein
MKRLKSLHLAAQGLVGDAMQSARLSFSLVSLAYALPVSLRFPIESKLTLCSKARPKLATKALEILTMFEFIERLKLQEQNAKLMFEEENEEGDFEYWQSIKSRREKMETSKGRFDHRLEKFKADGVALPAVRHYGWWLLHNVASHSLLGLCPVSLTFKFHDWTSKRLNKE